MAVTLPQSNQDRQQGFQTLAARPVCGLPKQYQPILSRRLGRPRTIATPRCLAVRVAAQQAHRMLPMQASSRDELVEDTALFDVSIPCSAAPKQTSIPCTSPYSIASGLPPRHWGAISMRQQLSIQEHFWRRNATVTLIAARHPAQPAGPHHPPYPPQDRRSGCARERVALPLSRASQIRSQ